MRPGLILALAPLVLLLGAAATLGVILLTAPKPVAGDALIGQPFPSLSRPSLESARTSGAPETQDPADLVLADALTGEGPSLVNLFASWCAPCRVEHPMLMALADEGVTIHAVAWKDSPGAAQAFLDELGNPFDVIVVDRDGRLGAALGVTGAPETFVVDAAGHVRAIWRGPLDPGVMARVIRPALTEAATPLARPEPRGEEEGQEANKGAGVDQAPQPAG